MSNARSRALAAGEVAALDNAPQFLDLIAVDRTAAGDHLETVIL